MGPVECLVITFDRDSFDGSIAPALAELVDRGVVRIMDLVFVHKDAGGEVETVELADLDPDHAVALAFAGLEGEVGELLSESDLALFGEALDPGTAAVFVVWEDVWAAALGAAVERNGGSVLFHQRVPEADMDAALAAVAAATGGE